MKMHDLGRKNPYFFGNTHLTLPNFSAKNLTLEPPANAMAMDSFLWTEEVDRASNMETMPRL